MTLRGRVSELVDSVPLTGDLGHPVVLVNTGLHARTRSPIHVGFALAHLGLAAATRNGWALPVRRSRPIRRPVSVPVSDRVIGVDSSTALPPPEPPRGG